MHRNVIETIMGAVVLAVAIVFLAFAYSGANVGSASGYQLMAKFDRIDGVSPGTDVRVSGVKVGAVSSITLDPQSYLAVMHLVVDPSIQLPADTVAIVSSDGLLGGKTVALSPGGDSEMLKDGDTIQYTQSTPSLEQLLGQVIFSLQGAGAKEEPAAGASSSGSQAGGSQAGGSQAGGSTGGLLSDN